MSRTVYVNVEYLDEAEARISVFDRGFLFADAVYEVTAVLDGRLVDFPAHLARLHRSLDALRLPAPATDEGITAIHRELVARNALAEGLIYLQISRGAADRDFLFPPEPRPSLVAFTQARPLVETEAARKGISIITLPDLRWARRDIKTVQLLAPSLTRMQARDAGADDAWMVEHGFVTEGTSSNAWIVRAGGRIITRDLSPSILHGITRSAVLACARDSGLTVEERPFTPGEAREAAEAFVTAASAFVTPVVAIDGTVIGDGTPGPVTTRLREIYVAESRRRAI